MVVLAVGAACAPLLAERAVPLHRVLLVGTPSVVGQSVPVGHFPAGAAGPLVVVAPACRTADVRTTVAATSGVGAAVAVPGRPPRILARLTDTPDSEAARNTEARLRTSLAGTGALVGGPAPTAVSGSGPPLSSSGRSSVTHLVARSPARSRTPAVAAAAPGDAPVRPVTSTTRP
ncbi:hypothetical protein GCM10010347_42410 [Streptomyces cirratus]|uniref:Uncharacterized protein n=1 Tax=Streptomyces cirratus TaxID=68187 RepID=A0ABQ3F0N3_9ACTN|nr:hypothetical protein GCM10010347_42410 [Streptomyces cirratus]